MADITARVQKKAHELLDPGEVVIAALLVEPKGTYGAGSVALAALPRTAMRKLASNAANDLVQAGGLAASFPAKSCIIVVTDRRVVAIPSNGISMKEIVATYDRTDLRVSDNQSKGLGRRLQLTFIDNSTVTVDAQRGQQFEVFTQSIGTP